MDAAIRPSSPGPSLRSRLWLGCWLGLIAGCCALGSSQVDRTLRADSLPDPHEESAKSYCVRCPDVIQIYVHGHPELAGTQTIGTDGRIALGKYGRLRVEGRTPREIAALIAEVSGVLPESVLVRVVQFNSQQVYLFGQVAGKQREVPYHGQETVLDLLQRVGGLTRGAAPNDVYVVRTGIVEGKQPQVYHIDLHAILDRGDKSTNLRLMPFDEIYVGETRKSCLLKCIPPCLRPIYESICGLRRPAAILGFDAGDPTAPTPTPAAPKLPDPGHMTHQGPIVRVQPAT